MADTFEKNIDGIASYQQNHLTCWAAVALTAYRAKHGKAGRGGSLYSLFGAPGGEPFKKMLMFAEEIIADMQDNRSNLLGAKSNVIKRDPSYATVPDGLGSHSADALFRSFLKMRITRLVDGGAAPAGTLLRSDKAGLKALIKKHAPLVIYTSQAGQGHLRLITGYWDGGDDFSPQIIIWDPEAPLNAMDAGVEGATDDKNWPSIAKSRVLWPHFQQQIVDRLQRGELYHY
jgi:hypothetical protein